jgi:hypothetical protein
MVYCFLKEKMIIITTAQVLPAKACFYKNVFGSGMTFGFLVCLRK